MPEKYTPENKQHNPNKMHPILQEFFNSLKNGEQIEINEDEKEKYGISALGPFGENQLHFKIEKAREFTGVEKKAEDFVKDYTQKFLETLNKERKNKGQNPIQDRPKINISDIKNSNEDCYITATKDEVGYGRIPAFKGEGLNNIYKEYSSQYQGEEEILSIEEFKNIFMPHLPGTSALIVTSDNKILLTKRNPKKTAIYSEAWHLPAGGMDKDDTNEKEVLSPFVTIKREIKEEVGLEKDQIDNLTCLGICQNPYDGATEFLFVANTPISSENIVSEGKLILEPKDIDGNIRPKKLTRNEQLSSILPALSRIDKIYGKEKTKTPGPDLTVPTSQALFFLVDKILKKE